MTNIIIGIIIGVVVWQLLVLVIGLGTDFVNEKAIYFLCGVWFVLFCIIIKPIIFLIRKIIFYHFYSKYLKCNFITQNETVLTFYIDKDIAKTFETATNKKYYVEITKANYNGLPHCGDIITKEKIEMHPEKYEFLNKWKRID